MCTMADHSLSSDRIISAWLGTRAVWLTVDPYLAGFSTTTKNHVSAWSSDETSSKPT